MLTEKQIDKLPAGEYPNHILRMKFGTNHGSVIKVAYLDEQKQIRETEFVGNRQQRKFFKKNPTALIGDYKRMNEKAKFQVNRIDNMKKSGTPMKRVLDFIKSMFGFLNIGKA